MEKKPWIVSGNQQPHIGRAAGPKEIRQRMPSWRRVGRSEPTTRPKGLEEGRMRYYALVFFIIAVIAGLLGFGVIASAAAGIAKILFFVFLVLFIVTLIGHSSRVRSV